MDDLPAKYKCPACNQAVLNRSIGHCLYCSANLPPEFLFSKEKIARLAEEQHKQDESRKFTNPGPTVERSNVADGINLLGSLGNF